LLEYQIGTKSKAFALRTFCILSAYFIKNIYIVCVRVMGIIQSCGKFYAPKISEKRICQTNEKVAFGRERERERRRAKDIDPQISSTLTHTRSAKNYNRLINLYKHHSASMYGVIEPNANNATFALTPNIKPNIKPACSSLLPLLVSLVARGHKAREKA
jgi:hypothetical protein